MSEPANGLSFSDPGRWDAIYAQKGVDGVSWAQTHPTESLSAITRLKLDSGAAIVDIGGGGSRLACELIERGFANVAVLDISAQALTQSRARSLACARAIQWINADVLDWTAREPIWLWHDRAVFHFLTSETDRHRYRARLRQAVAPGGAVMMQAFANGGPSQCSGLPVVRYDPLSLRDAVDPQLTLSAYGWARHLTPGGPSSLLSGR